MSFTFNVVDLKKYCPLESDQSEHSRMNVAKEGPLDVRDILNKGDRGNNGVVKILEDTHHLLEQPTPEMESLKVVHTIGLSSPNVTHPTRTQIPSIRLKDYETN